MWLRIGWSIIDQIFILGQILEKKWEYNGNVHQNFVQFKQAYTSVSKDTLCDILLETEFLESICMFETHNRISN